MRTRLTQKQETFCLKYFELGNASKAARLAKYSPKTAAVIGRENLLKPQIQARINELRQRTEDASVMGVLERKQRLTEIGRAKLTDFMELGQDGSWVNIGEETSKGGAIQEIHSRTEYDDNGSKPIVYTSVKLHDPMKAIDLLNKMDKLYSDGAFIQNNVNRTVNIFVIDNETKDLLSQVGERTKLIGNTNHQGIQGNPQGVGRGQETS
jgi:phage terminase small subunit